MHTHSFDDFDAFASSIKGVDSDMLQRNPEHRSWTIQRVELGEIELQVGRLGSGNIARGQVHDDVHMLYLPLTAGIEYSGNGVVIEPGSLLALEPGCEFCVSTKRAHDWCAVSVPTDRLPSHLIRSLSRSVRVTAAMPEVAQALHRTAADLITTASSVADFEATRGAKEAGTEILQSVMAALGGDQGQRSCEGRPRVPREIIIRRSMELLEERGDAEVKVADFASAAGVSERTLRTAFQEYFGVGPARYLQLRRLHRVRRALQRAAPDATTVAQVLMAHGEWSFSRFAARYHELFDEFPSETLTGVAR